MSFPSTAPALHAVRSTTARHVSTDSGVSKPVRSRSTAGTTRSSSSASDTSGPGPAFTPPTSSTSAPSVTSCSARRRSASSANVSPASKNESGVRLRMPMTRARSVTWWTPSPRRKRIDSEVTASPRPELRRSQERRARDDRPRGAAVDVDGKPREERRHPEHGSGEERRRRLEQRGQTGPPRLDHAAGDARREAEHGQRSRDGPGDQVGGERGERHRAEHRDEDRRHADLRRQRHAQRLAAARRGGGPSRDWRGGGGGG